MPIEGTATFGVEKARVTASPRTLSGATASLDGALQGEVVGGDGSVEPGNGSLDVVIRQGSAIGDVVVRVFGDADLGAGLQVIEDLVTVHFVAERAANLGLGVVAEPI